MKVHTLLAGLGLLLLYQCQLKPTLEGENLIVLRGGIIIDGNGYEVISGKDLIIENRLIKSISPIGQYNYPDNSIIIDLSDKYILPGFIEMHAHLPADTSIQKEVMLTYLSFGVTTILNPGATFQSGLALKQKIDSNKIFGPRVFTAGKLINGSSVFDENDLFQTVKNEEEARAEVQKQIEEGVDFIKTYAHLGSDLLKVVIDESHLQGKKVIGHLGETSWKEATESGIDIIVHSALAGPTWELVPDEYQEKFRSNYLPSINWPEGYDASLFNEWADLVDYKGKKTQDLISILFKNNVTVDPNLVVFESFVYGNKIETKRRLRPEYAPKKWRLQWTSDINPSTSSWSDEDFLAVQKAWPKFLKFIRILHENGILLTAGTDLIVPWITPGIAYHRELELLVEAGISSSDVIQIATKNGASVLGVLDEIGTIEEGKIANLVILEADPIQNIANTKEVYSVMLEGKFFSKTDLENLVKSNVNGL
jgi:imidazolonepropionase-like amidohydrolase